MKNIVKLIGVIAFVAVIGFTFAACGGGDDGPGPGGPGTGGGVPPDPDVPPVLDTDGIYIINRKDIQGIDLPVAGEFGAVYITETTQYIGDTI